MLSVLVKKVRYAVKKWTCAKHIRRNILEGRSLLVSGCQSEMLRSTFSYGFLRGLRSRGIRLLVLDFSGCKARVAQTCRALLSYTQVGRWRILKDELDEEALQWLAAKEGERVAVVVILSPKGCGAETLSHLIRLHYRLGMPYSVIGFVDSSGQLSSQDVASDSVEAFWLCEKCDEAQKPKYGICTGKTLKIIQMEEIEKEKQKVNAVIANIKKRLAKHSKR